MTSTLKLFQDVQVMGCHRQPDERQLLTVLMGIETRLRTRQPIAILPYEGTVIKQNFNWFF